MQLNFKKWIEDCGQVTSAYSNVNDDSFAKSGVASKYTGGQKKVISKFDPKRIFQKRGNRK